MRLVKFYMSHEYLAHKSEAVGGIEVFYEELRALRRLVGRSPHVTLEDRYDAMLGGYEIAIIDYKEAGDE